MTRLTPIQLDIANLLEQRPKNSLGYMTKEQALELLKKRSGQNYGYDAKRWVQWVRENEKDEWEWAGNHILIYDLRNVIMRNFILRVIIYAIGIALVAEIVPGIHVANDTLGTLLIIGIVFGIINAILKPIITFLTCPLVILSLGLFVLVINAVVLLVTASLIPARLQIDGFWPAFLGGIVMSIISMILERILGVNDDNNRGGKNKRNPDVIVVDRR